MSDDDWDKFGETTTTESISERPDFDAFEYAGEVLEWRIIPDKTTVQVAVVEAGEKTNDFGRTIEVKLQVTDGEYKDALLWKNFKVWDSDPETQRKQRAAYSKFLGALGHTSVPAYSQLIAQTCKATVGVYQTQKGESRNNVRFFTAD